jgi:hypothetical protein
MTEQELYRLKRKMLPQLFRFLVLFGFKDTARELIDEHFEALTDCVVFHQDDIGAVVREQLMDMLEDQDGKELARLLKLGEEGMVEEFNDYLWKRIESMHQALVEVALSPGMDPGDWPTKSEE